MAIETPAQPGDEPRQKTGGRHEPTPGEGTGPTEPGRDVVYNRIAMLRAERGISRRELADALGVHYQTVGYLERGEYSPSLHLALRIADHFTVPVEVIFSTHPFPRLGDPTT